MYFAPMEGVWFCAVLLLRTLVNSLLWECAQRAKHDVWPQRNGDIPCSSSTRHLVCLLKSDTVKEVVVFMLNLSLSAADK